MREYLVDLTAVASWSDFIAAFNEGLVRHVGGDWSGNLDAFNDYLYWSEEHPYRLVLLGWSKCHPHLESHKGPDGRPILDVVAEILEDNKEDKIGVVDYR